MKINPQLHKVHYQLLSVIVKEKIKVALSEASGEDSQSS